MKYFHFSHERIYSVTVNKNLSPEGQKQSNVHLLTLQRSKDSQKGSNRKGHIDKP